MSAYSYASDAKIQEALTNIGGGAVGTTVQTLLQQILVAAATASGGGGGGGATAWGSITGTLSAQTDLQTALNAKPNLAGGNTFTGGAQVLAAGVGLSPASSGGTSLGQYNLGFSDVRTRKLQIENGAGNFGWYLDQDEGILLGMSARIGFANAAASSFSNMDAFWTRKGVAFIGQGIASATPIDQYYSGPDGVGSNIVGGALRIGPGQSTGNASPAVLALQGTSAGGSGSTAQALVDVLSITSSTQIDIADGVFVYIGETTGTTFGGSLSKIGFFGNNAVVKPVSDSTTGIATDPGGGTPISDNTTFNGGSGGESYTIGGLIKRLKELGLLTT